MVSINYVPRVKEGHALAAFILNVLFPGWGTIVVGVCIGDLGVFLTGVFMLLLVPILLIGWVWSIVWGYDLYKRSKSRF
eukprot:Nk52_evm2s1865 gene=Nk52_evmTU2s1865